MSTDLKKMQLEDKNGYPVIPLTVASSVFFRSKEEIRNPGTDVSGSTISTEQFEGAPVSFNSSESSSRTSFLPVIPDNIYMVTSDVACPNFYKLFVDSDGNCILNSKDGISYLDQSSGVLLTAPENAKYLVVNTKFEGVECVNLQILHIENLQRKVEKTDLNSISGETVSGLQELYTLEARGVNEVRLEGSGYTIQLESLLDTADIMDSKEFPLHIDYDITPNFEQFPYKNIIGVSVVEYGERHPELRHMYIDKTYNGNTERLYDSYRTEAVVEIVNEIQYGKETFEFHAEKWESVKEATETTTRYLCFLGTSKEKIADWNMADSLKKYLLEDIDMEMRIHTTDGDYIWFIVPDGLHIKSVRSSGFEVTLEKVTQQLELADYGSYNAYRTYNALGEATWKLVISQA